MCVKKPIVMRNVILFLFVMLCISANAYEHAISLPEKAQKYESVITQNGLLCPQFVSFRDFVGDTIRFCSFIDDRDAQFYEFKYLNPDTIWVKTKKKNPVEGKHYFLLHYFGSSYELNKKNVFLYDYTVCDQICSPYKKVYFLVDDYVGDSAFYLTELESKRKIVLNPHRLGESLYIRSSKKDAYYSQILHSSYYTYQKLNKISKKYTKRKIFALEPYVNNRGELFFYTNIITSEPCATYEQYIADSIAEAKYWEEYNRPHYIDYVVKKLDIPYDTTNFGAITDFEGGKIAILLKSKNARIGQAVIDGVLQEDETLNKDELFWFVGIDSIRGREYIIGGKTGKFFYIDIEDVVIDWDFQNEEKRIYKINNSQLLENYRISSEDIKRNFAAYMKSFVYKEYKQQYDRVYAKYKVLSSRGIMFTDMTLTDDDYYYSTGLSFSLINLSSKTIKYIALTTKGLNPVKDPIESKTVRGIGPIAPGESATYEFDNVWWTDLVEYHKPTTCVITYMDGSTKTLNAKDLDLCWMDDDLETEMLMLKRFTNLKAAVWSSKTNQVEDY